MSLQKCTCADTSVCSHNFITNIKLNQDNSCFGIATKMGFIVYCTNPVTKRYFTVTSNRIRNIDLHYRTNIIMYIQDPGDRVCIWDQLKCEKVAHIQFESPIINLVHTKECIVIVLADTIYIYDTVSVTELAQFPAISPNGCVALHSYTHSDNMTILLAHSGVTEGEIVIETINQMTNTNVSIVSGSYLPNATAGTDIETKKITKTSQTFQAHVNAIQMMTFNSDASVLASVSVRGTLIRLWNVTQCEKISEFRRGSDPALVSSLKFNKQGNQLLVTSNKGTIHIFSTDPPKTNYLSWILPTYFSSVWSCRKISIPNMSLHNCIATFIDTPHGTGVIAMCYDGYIYKFTLTVDPVSLVDTCNQEELNILNDISLLYKLK